MAFVMSEFLIFTRLTRLKALISLSLFNLYYGVSVNFCGAMWFLKYCLLKVCFLWMKHANTD